MKIRKILALMLSTLVISFYSCSDGIVSELPPEKNIKIRANFTSIQAEVFDKYCISCHAGNFASGSLDLTAGKSFNNLVDKLNSSGNKKLIETGSVVRSYLIDRLESNSDVMPPTGKIEQYLIDSLKVWIEQGALNN